GAGSRRLLVQNKNDLGGSGCFPVSEEACQVHSSVFESHQDPGAFPGLVRYCRYVIRNSCNLVSHCHPPPTSLRQNKKQDTCFIRIPVDRARERAGLDSSGSASGWKK